MTRGKMEALQRHKARINFDIKCPVCHAEPRANCVIGNSVPDEPGEINCEREWLEFQVLCAINNLKDFDPNHYLVRLVRAGLKPFDNDNTPALLKRQAE